MPKYNSPENIPAKIFFEILHSKDYMKLKPKPKEKLGMDELKKIFDIELYDYFFLKSDNPDAKEYFKLENQYKSLAFTISTIENILKVMFVTPLEKESVNRLIDAMNEGTEGVISIDKDKDLLSEISRIQQKDIGWLKNDLNFVDAEMKAMVKSVTPSKEEYDFYADLVALGNALPNNGIVKADMTLAEYIAVSNAAIKIGREFKKNQKPNGK